MSEIKPLLKVVVVSLAIGILAFLLVWFLNPGGNDGKLSVDRYQATLSADGKLTETYTYDVGEDNRYTMLYRTWEAPVSTSVLSGNSVQVLDFGTPPGMVGYVKDTTGNFDISGEKTDPSVVNAMKKRAGNNEVGFFKPDGFLEKGTYTFTTVYQLHPPVTYDDQWTSVNLRLAGAPYFDCVTHGSSTSCNLAGPNHVPYNTVRITIPAAYAERMHVYPLNLKTEKNGDTVEITGSLAGNENLALEFLLPNEQAGQLRKISGSATPESNLPGATDSAYSWYVIHYTLSSGLKTAGMAGVLAVPFILLLLYARSGREKKFVVPHYLSTMPRSELKAWQVNFLIRHDAAMLDKDALYATLLDLQRRKMISITEKPDQKHLEIRVLSKVSEDPYEQRVLNLLTYGDENGVFDTEKVETSMKSFGNQMGYLYGLTIYHLTTQNPDPSLVGRYITVHRKKFLWLFIGGIILSIACIALWFSDPVGFLLGPALLFWIVISVQFLLAYRAPLTLFGTWKGD